MKENSFLIDTSVFIWWMEKNNRLSKELFVLLNDPQNQIFISIASVWEIVIKLGKKKLKLPQAIEKGLTASGFKLLPIEIQHVLAVKSLLPHHNDPFDRILITQSKVENLTLITSDPKIWKYKIKLLKC